MAEKVSLIKPRHLAYAGVILVGIQLGFVIFSGFMPPQFTAGYHQTEQGHQFSDQAQPLSASRLRELEAILSPVPLLSFSAPTSDFVIPEILPPSSVRDSAEKKVEGEAAPPETEENTAVAVIDPPKQPRIIPKQEKKTISIAPVYIKSLPDLSVLTVKQRKKQFIAFMLPLILRANIELDERRQRIDETFRNGESAKLKQWAALYHFDPQNLSDVEIHAELTRRVRPVPVSVALAQAAIESAWGTSRFAVQGNAVFGQWAWTDDAGIRPLEARYDNVVVRSFANLFASVRAYMHNLNTHYAYDRFRDVRLQMVNAPIETRIPAIIATLDQYSEKREVYIDMLFDVMDDNDFWVFDQARLTEK